MTPWRLRLYGLYQFKIQPQQVKTYFSKQVSTYIVWNIYIETNIVVSSTINSYIKTNHLKISESQTTIFQMIDRTFEISAEEYSLLVPLSGRLNDGAISWNVRIHLLIRYLLRYYCRKNVCSKK